MFKICSFFLLLIAIFLFNNDSLWKYFHSSFLNEPEVPKSTSSKTGLKIFTKEDLKVYDGIAKAQIYLALLGNVFDVTRGTKHYGPGQPYHYFAGKDASRNFISGKFTEEDLSDDVSDFSDGDLLSLNHWVEFYEKAYEKVGVIIGRYYNSDGEITLDGVRIKNLIKKALENKQNEELLKEKFPPCNVEWSKDTGTRVWCTNKSGGIHRNWIGVPRQLYEPGSKEYRCVCVNLETQTNQLKEYEGCDLISTSCFIKDI